MPTRLANLGYMALGKESVKGTPVATTVYVPLYDDSLTTAVNMDDDNPIVGQKMLGFAARQGMRSHMGDVTVLGEPNTIAHLFNMMYTKGTTTGAGPFTHPFILDPVTDPKSYTLDIQKGQVVHRYFGAEISEFTQTYNKSKLEGKFKVSALGSFIVREVASVTTNVVTLKTNYDPSPTTGLVNSDLIRIQPALGGVAQDFTLSSFTATTMTLSGSPAGIVAGDLIFLRGATPSYTLRSPFLWPKTQFFFNTTAAAAFAGAQTRVEEGSKYTLLHKFEKNEGAMRSGGFDPATLNRTQGDAELSVKLFFDTLDDFNRFLTLQKRACVIRHYSEDTTYELRVTLNNLVAKEAPVPIKSAEIVYCDFKFSAFYDTTDAQGLDIKVLNNLATV